MFGLSYYTQCYFRLGIGKPLQVSFWGFYPNLGNHMEDREPNASEL
jgi:hypothetical protein